MHSHIPKFISNAKLGNITPVNAKSGNRSYNNQATLDGFCNDVIDRWYSEHDIHQAISQSAFYAEEQEKYRKPLLYLARHRHNEINGIMNLYRKIFTFLI